VSAFWAHSVGGPTHLAGDSHMLEPAPTHPPHHDWWNCGDTIIFFAER